VIKFLEISALAIANDLLHIPKDKMNGVKTFPIAYGLWVSKLSIVVIASLQLIIVFVVSNKITNSNGFIVSSLVSVALIMISVSLIHFKKNKGVELLLDVIIGIEALFLLAFSVLY
jgi:4-hydroxybenzoate polyprenyltransferase